MVNFDKGTNNFLFWLGQGQFCAPKELGTSFKGKPGTRKNEKHM